MPTRSAATVVTAVSHPGTAAAATEPQHEQRREQPCGGPQREHPELRRTTRRGQPPRHVRVRSDDQCEQDGGGAEDPGDRVPQDAGREHGAHHSQRHDGDRAGGDRHAEAVVLRDEHAPRQEQAGTHDKRDRPEECTNAGQRARPSRHRRRRGHAGTIARAFPGVLGSASRYHRDPRRDVPAADRERRRSAPCQANQSLDCDVAPRAPVSGSPGRSNPDS